MNKGSQPVRRMTESRVNPLPAKWETVSHPKINKAVVVLSTHTTDTILAGGGFSDATQIESPNPDTDTSHLEAVTKVFLQ